MFRVTSHDGQAIVTTRNLTAYTWRDARATISVDLDPTTVLQDAYAHIHFDYQDGRPTLVVMHDGMEESLVVDLRDLSIVQEGR